MSKIILLVLCLSFIYYSMNQTVVLVDCNYSASTLACNGTKRSWDFKPIPFNLTISNVSTKSGVFFEGTYNAIYVRVDCLPQVKDMYRSCLIREIVNYTASTYAVKAAGKCLTPSDPIYKSANVCGCSSPSTNSAPEYTLGQVLYENCADSSNNEIRMLNCTSIIEYDTNNFYCSGYIFKNIDL